MAEDIVHPLRLRMIEDMTARNLDEKTQRGYIRWVRSCCRFCHKQPAQLTYEDVRRFQLQLMQSGLAPGTVNSAMIGLGSFSGSRCGGLRLWTTSPWRVSLSDCPW